MADENPIPDLGQMVAEAIAKYGDEASALQALAAEGIALTAEAAAVASSVTLTAEQAAEWEEYRKIGTAADAERIMKENPILAAQNATYKREAAMRDVVEGHGVNVSVLKKLAGPDLSFETKAVKFGGKTVDVLHVREGAAAPVPFDEYAAKNWEPFLAALKPTAPVRHPGTPSRLDPYRPTMPAAPSSNGHHRDSGTDLLDRARASF